MKQTYNQANRDLQIWVGDGLYHRDQARVSVFDSLVQGGDGCWEGLRLYDGRIFKLEEHLLRLRHSAQALAFAEIPSDDDLIDAIRATLVANQMHTGVHIRLTLSRGTKITSGMDPRLNQSGPTLIVLAEHKPPVYDTTGLRLVSSSLRRFPPDCLDPKIHHNNLLQSILAKVEANAADADDALLLDVHGFVAETNATHLFGVCNGGLFTSTTAACPEGVTRATVLELCKQHSIECEVRAVSQAELYRADEVFCTGTMGELAAVVSIDGRTIGSGRVGPVTQRLSELYRALTQESGTRIVP